MPDKLPWQWDTNVRRYRSPDGRFIGQKGMLEQRDRFTDAVKDRFNDLGRKVANGDITLQQFVTQGRDLIKAAHIDTYVLAKGGRNAMTQSDWGKVGSQVKSQYQYWQGFAEAIATGDMTEAGILNRANMYGDAPLNSYYHGQVSAAHAAGLTEERNVLGPNEEHCDGCLEQEARGWVPIGGASPAWGA